MSRKKRTKYPLNPELHMHSSFRYSKDHSSFFPKNSTSVSSFVKNLYHVRGENFHKYFGSRNKVFYPPFFYDSIIDVKSIVRRVCELGIKIVAITNHDSLS